MPEVCKLPGLPARGRSVIIWLDAHLSPSLARWIAGTFAIECASARDLGLRDALDPPLFAAARAAGAIVMTKDADFPEMVERLGSPPRFPKVFAGAEDRLFKIWMLAQSHFNPAFLWPARTRHA